MLGSSLLSILADIESKKTSSKEVNDYFRKRISKYDKDLNCYMSQSKDDRDDDGPLKGIGLAIKDNFLTKGLRTTASSKVLDEYKPQYNATVVNKLAKAGSSVLGKTNMDAWAHGSSTETSDYGPTRNPFDTSKVAGGSSGGSSAVISSYLAPAAIGSETAGSIRGPASWSGVVGMKPTYGRVSRYGVVAMGSSWDCPGTLTSTVEDAAFILRLIAGQDKYDATTSPKKVEDYLKKLDGDTKYTIGVSEEYIQNLDEDVLEEYERVLNTLKKMGHTLKKVELIDPKYAISVYMVLQRSEVSSNLGRYDGIRYGNNRSFFGQEAERRIMLGTYSLSSGYYDAYYKTAQKVRKLIYNNFVETFKEVDVIFAPTMPITATTIGDMDDFSFYGEAMDVLSEPGAAAGVPAISIPTGLSKKGLPIGMQFMGPHFNEQLVLNIGHQLEKEIAFDRISILNEKYNDE